MVSDRQNNVYGVSRPISTFSSNSNSVSVDITGNWIFYYLFNLNYGATPHNANLTAEPQVTPGTGTFRINFHNTGQPINIKEMGVWLPNGFSYAGSPSGITTRPPVQVPVYGGANLAWGQDHVLSYHLGTGDSAYQQFRYNPIGGDPREAACWVRPQESVGVSWDNDVVWYDVTSTAVDSFSSRTTTIEAIMASQSGASSSVTLVTYDINP